MSYTLIGHFVDVKNKKLICSAELGFMKNLNTRRYSNDFDGIDPTGTADGKEYPFLTEYRSSSFIGYYRKEFLDDESIKGLYKEKVNNEISTEADSYVFLEGEYDSCKDYIKKYEAKLSVSEIMEKKSDFRDNYIILYASEVTEVNGKWFKASDFLGVQDKLRNEFFEKKSRLDKLNSMKDTRDWFEMSESARNNLIEEIGYAKEDLEEAEWKYDSIVKMNNILDFISEDLGFRYVDEDGCTRYKWYYDDNREIEVYIEVD